MRLVVADEEDIPGWLYPQAFPEVPRPPENCFTTPTLGESDFDALWRAVDATANNIRALEAQQSHCSTGVPHNAPDYVGRVNPVLVARLAALPEEDRWRVAQTWALARLGKRPNQAELTQHKELLKALCGLAKTASERRLRLLLL